MATSSKILCAICEGQHLSKCAVIWCPECDEGFCNDCEKHHELAKATRNHAIISIDNYHKLPTDISKIVHHCEDHGRKFQNFCPQHEHLCCPTCISLNHKNCSGLLDLDDLVKKAKTSTLIENLELSIIEIRKHIDMIIKDRRQNLTEIEVQRKRFQDEIEKKREQINCMLDKLETTLINELAEEENKIKLQIQSLLSKLEERSETVDNLQNKLESIKTHATDLQTFFGCKTLSEQIFEEEKYIESLSENGSLQQISLKCDISDKLFNMVTEFGSISINYNPPLVLLSKEKHKQAQIISPVKIQPTRGIDQVSLKVNKTLEIPTVYFSLRITEVDISPNRKVIIVDFSNSQLIIFNQDCSVDKLIPFSYRRPYDVTCIDDSYIAVSCFDKKEIKIVNIVSGTVSGTINTDYVCDGLTQLQGKLIYCGREHGIMLHDADGKTSTTIVKDAINTLSYVTSFEDKVYHTNCHTHIVSCYKTSGGKVWEYKDASILKIPFGVTIDNHSNVYVASSGTDSIVIISPDGKHARQILKSEDGIRNPRSIQFDKDRNLLIVACYDGDVKMYNVL